VSLKQYAGLNGKIEFKRDEADAMARNTQERFTYER